ncbi:transposase, partial [Bacillota bacterium Meth-B3]
WFESGTDHQNSALHGRFSYAHFARFASSSVDVNDMPVSAHDTAEQKSSRSQREYVLTSGALPEEHSAQERNSSICVFISLAFIFSSSIRALASTMPVRFFVTARTTAVCTVAAQLIEGFAAQYLLADRGYGTNEIIAATQGSGIEAVIPSKKNRKAQRDYHRHLYKLRHLVENAFLHLKRWRGVATRYAKNSASFVAAIQIRCIAVWSAIY